MSNILRLWGKRLCWWVVACIVTLFIAAVPAGFSDRDLIRAPTSVYRPAASDLALPFHITPDTPMQPQPGSALWSVGKYATFVKTYVPLLVSGELKVQLADGSAVTQMASVTTLMYERGWRSFQVVLFAMVVGVVLGCVMGYLSAVSGWIRAATQGVAVVGLALPDFILVQAGWILTIWTYVHLNWKPWSITGGANVERGWLLPALVLCVAPMGYSARLLSVTLDQVLRSDFIRTARAKGLPGWKVISKHAFKNAIPVVLDAAPTMFSVILSSLLVVELLCQYPGLGIWVSRFRQPVLVTTGSLVFCTWYCLFDALAQTLKHWAHPWNNEARI